MADGTGIRYSPDRRPRSKPNTLHFAIETDDIKKVEEFVAQGIKSGNPESVTLQSKEEVLGLMPIHIACELGHEKLVEYLISKRVDLDAGDKYHVTAMHLAAIEGHDNIVKMLLAARANAQAADEEGDTPLHWAATKGHVDVIKALYQAGSPLESPNTSGWTPLHRAAYNGRRDATEFLIKAGALMQAKNKDGNTPLHLAVIMNHLSTVEAICQNGCKQDCVNNRHKTPGDLCLNDATREVLMLYNWKKLILGKDIPLTEEEEEERDQVPLDAFGDLNFKSDGRSSRTSRPKGDEGFPDLPPVEKKDRRSRDGERWSSSAFLQEAGGECERVSAGRAGPYALRKSAGLG